MENGGEMSNGKFYPLGWDAFRWDGVGMGWYDHIQYDLTLTVTSPRVLTTWIHNTSDAGLETEFGVSPEGSLNWSMKYHMRMNWLRNTTGCRLLGIYWLMFTGLRIGILHSQHDTRNLEIPTGDHRHSEVHNAWRSANPNGTNAEWCVVFMGIGRSKPAEEGENNWDYWNRKPGWRHSQKLHSHSSWWADGVACIWGVMTTTPTLDSIPQ